VVRAGGLEPPQALLPYGFSYQLRLSPLSPAMPTRQVRVCGLDYPFTVLRPSRRLGAARLVSTPSRPGLRPFRAWLGIASQGFPEFGQFCIQGFPWSTQVVSSPLRLPVSPRPRDAASISPRHRRGLAHFRVMRRPHSMQSPMPVSQMGQPLGGSKAMVHQVRSGMLRGEQRHAYSFAFANLR
jgi:hypothetical protein